MVKSPQISFIDNLFKQVLLLNFGQKATEREREKDKCKMLRLLYPTGSYGFSPFITVSMQTRNACGLWQAFDTKIQLKYSNKVHID